ncbi:hypothetical protein LOAG_14814 [Loa loa]|uniref:Secreted protein n=1 Tax=Loa loa TaxID=7209 RepID=A0A1I7VFY1_LOALO|nr:hypothetical protein LOAG_14814 [Loa loa]EFO13715.2 hypothetical protein LOAG_14814 [Loa loa]
MTMYLSTVCFCPILMISVVLIDINNGLSVPAGLRPAKKVGDPKEQIIPGKQQQQQQQQQEQQQQHDEGLNIRPTPKVPPNLSIRSRMMAALSASSPGEASKENNTSKVETGNSSKPPIIFPKGHKKTIPGKTGSSGTSKGNIRVIVVPPATPGKNNYGLNTVLQTNLVDSRGRVMKNVSSVPIKVPSSAEMRNARTRHTARQVESDADKVVPIKFGSTSRRR